MPKYKSPDGQVFDSIEAAKKYFCSHFSTIECAEMCPLHARRNTKKMICRDFVIEYSDSAARLMGYEIIEEETLIDGTNRLTDTLTMDEQEDKSDGGKPRPSLVPPALIRGTDAVREYGTKTYGSPDNWRKVEPQRYWDALLRHVLAAWDDWQAVDPESGLPHLHHIICNAGFLEQYMEEEQDGKANQE